MSGSRDTDFEIEGETRPTRPKRTDAFERLWSAEGGSGSGKGPGQGSSGKSGQDSAPRFLSNPPGFLANFLILLTLFGLGTFSVAISQEAVGYSWDEAYYYKPAAKAADWLAGVVRGELEPLEPAVIEKYWGERSEHPSFHKLLAGTSLRMFGDQPWMGPLHAMRLPSALLFGLTLGLLYLLGSRAWGTTAGLVAAIAYLFTPRIFGHAHFSTMETPLIFSSLLFVYCFVRGLHSKFWSILTGVSLGLLLATKINGFFFIPPLILWAHLYARRQYVNNLFAMIVLGPIFLVLLWPWLWNDTPLRILQYLAFHVTHQETSLYFLGEKWGYGRPRAPWFYSSVMVVVTLPVSILAFSSLGLLRTIGGVFSKPLPILFLMLGLASLGLASLPSTPHYDGVRLFLPLFGYVALLAGGGVDALVRALHWASARRGKGSGMASVAAFALVLALVLEGGLGILRYHPFELSYFNSLVGGLEGAQEQGFEVSYWGEALNEDVIEVLNQQIPDGATLKPLAMHELCLRHFQEWGILKSSILIAGDPPYDYPPPYYAHLLQHRRGFFTQPETVLADSKRFRVIKEWTHDGTESGVPMMTLYKTGATFEAYMRTVMTPRPPRPVPLRLVRRDGAGGAVRSRPASPAEKVPPVREAETPEEDVTTQELDVPDRASPAQGDSATASAPQGDSAPGAPGDGEIQTDPEPSSAAPETAEPAPSEPMPEPESPADSNSSDDATNPVNSID